MVEPFPFAAPGELRDRWPDFPPGAEAHAQVLLEDASQFILDICPSAVNASESTRRRVVCAVVRRSMLADQQGMAGVQNESLTSGPFAMSQTPSNPHGDFYLTKAERKALGEGKQKAFGATVAPSRTAENHRPWCSLAFGATYCSCGANLTMGDPLWEG